MKRILALLLLLPAIAFGQDLPAKYVASLSETGAGLSRGLILHIPFGDPASPLKAYVGDKPTFARTHDATHTATFVHPVTGLVTAADNNQLRIEAQGALFEEARTNVVTYSEQFNNAAWRKGDNVSILPDATTAPDGSTTADKVVLANGVVAGGDAGCLAQNKTSATPAGMSIFVKAAGIYTFILQDGSGNGASFNLLNGGIVPLGAVGAVILEALEGGWYRAVVPLTSGAPANPVFYWYFSAATGDGTSGIYVWGAQLELGASVSSYIPTTSVMARNSDVVTLPTIASPGTSIARVDGTLAEITYSGYNPTGHHVGDLRVWNRTLSAGEIAAVVGP